MKNGSNARFYDFAHSFLLRLTPTDHKQMGILHVSLGKYLVAYQPLTFTLVSYFICLICTFVKIFNICDQRLMSDQKRLQS